MKKIIKICILFLVSLFLISCSNSDTPFEPVIHKKPSNIPKYKIIRIRFINHPPEIGRLKCDDYCSDECNEELDIDNVGALFPMFSRSSSVSIGMPDTKTSLDIQKADFSLRNNNYYAEYEILGGSGTFMAQYYSFDPVRKTHKLYAYDVYLEAGKDYEFHPSINEAIVYEIDKNGNTKKVYTRYSRGCALLQ